MSREFPWEPLARLATVKAGTTPSRSKGERFYNGGTINWVKTGDLNDGWLSETTECVTAEAVDESSLIVHPPGTVLVAMYGGFQQIGRSAILARPATTNQAISALIPNPSKLIGEYLNYCLIFFRPNWRKVAASSRKDPNITKQDVLEFEIPIPPIHEQRRIAEILSSVDDAIAATRAVIEQTRKVKHGVLERLLTKGIGHTRFNQTEIGEIPEGWRFAALSTLLESSTYGLNTSMEPTPVGTPILRMGNIQDGEVSLAGLKYAVLDDATKEKYSILRGDLLFNRTNSRELVGKIAIAREDLNASFASYLIRLRANRFNDPFFIHSVLSSPRYQSLLRSIATPGASQANINATKLGNIVLPVPPIEEQREITKNMDALMVAENASLKSMNELEVTKSALMSDLLTGRKRVTDALPLAAE